MSFHVFFSFSSGLSAPLKVPAGTLAGIQKHVAEIEAELGLKRDRYEQNPEYWCNVRQALANYDGGEEYSRRADEKLCFLVEEHNDWVRRLYKSFSQWSETMAVKKRDAASKAAKALLVEEITPDQAATFWFALRTLEVPFERWSADYYANRMEAVYEVMRGRTAEGMSWEGREPLTPRQAASVIILFSQWMDEHDIRLDVPKDQDRLARSDDGGYTWCERCGAVDEDDVNSMRGGYCKSAKGAKCPLRAEQLAEDAGEAKRAWAAEQLKILQAFTPDVALSPKAALVKIHSQWEVKTRLLEYVRRFTQMEAAGHLVRIPDTKPILWKITAQGTAHVQATRAAARSRYC